jgi:hypothetical protein
MRFPGPRRDCQCLQHHFVMERDSISIKNIALLLGFSIASIFFFQTTQTLSFFWDDYALILKNQRLQDWKSIFYVFHDQSLMSAELEGLATHTYRPLRTLYFIILVLIFGKTPLIFFGMNLVFHFLNTLLFKKILDHFSPHTFHFLKSVFLVIFLFHPIHLENINTAGGIADLLGTFFFLTALWIGIRNPLPCTWKQTLSIGILCYLAMLCKEMFITTPWICMLACIPHKTKPPFTLKQVLFLGILSLIYFFQRQEMTGCLAQKSLALSIPEHMLYIFQTLGAYLIQFFFPVHLSQVYTIPPQESWMFWTLPLLLVAFMGLGMIALKKTWSAYCLAFFIALFPISNAIPINTFINDRLFYFPSLILGLFLFEFLKREVKPVCKIFCVGLGIFLMSACFYLGFQRNREWQDPAHIWEQAYHHSSSSLALWNMVCILFEKERYAELVHFFKTNPITLPENYIPFYYRVLCVACLKIGLEQEGWLYYQALLQAEQNTSFFTAKDWKEFLMLLERVNGSVKHRIHEELLRR